MTVQVPNFSDELRAFGLELRKEIVKNYLQSGVKASGNAIESLNEEIREKEYTLYGADYWQFIDKGRAANKSNSGGLFEAIYKWLQYKKYGFTYKDDKERRSLAYIITRKIAKEGTAKKRGDVPQSRILEKSLEDTIKSLIESVEQKVKRRVEIEVSIILKNAN